MEEISPTSYCRMLVIGLKYFAVGNFDSSASEHSANKKQVVIHIITWFFMEMGLVGEFFDAASFEQGVFSIVGVGFLTLSMAKFAMFSLNRNTLHKFIKLIDIDAVSSTKTDVYVKKAMEGIAVNMRIYALVSILGGSTFVVSSILSDKQSQPIERKLWEIFHFYIPYDVIIFERIGIATFIITIITFYHAYGSVILDLVSVSLFTHIGWQFEAIADMFKNVPYSENHEESKVRLKEAIDYHQHILWYAENLQKMHSVVFLMQLVSSCLQLCLALVLCVQNLKSADGSFVFAIGNLSFFGMLSFQLFLYTRCADLTEDKALSVSKGVYLSDWHLTAPSMRRDLIWVLMRAQHPINYSAMGIFPMTMATFSQIMRVSYGAFSMMTSLE